MKLVAPLAAIAVMATPALASSTTTKQERPAKAAHVHKAKAKKAANMTPAKSQAAK